MQFNNENGYLDAFLNGLNDTTNPNQKTSCQSTFGTGTIDSFIFANYPNAIQGEKYYLYIDFVPDGVCEITISNGIDYLVKKTQYPFVFKILVNYLENSSMTLTLVSGTSCNAGFSFLKV
jgi:hypothetical protein